MVAEFSLAVNRKVKDREEVSFFDVTAYGRQAETLVKYLHKGDPLLVEGKLRQERWQTREGQNRSRVVIDLDSFMFLGRPPEQAETPAASAAPTDPFAEDDIPF